MRQNIPKVDILGFSISKMNMDETVAYLTEAVHSRQPHQVITANPIIMMDALEHPQRAEALRQAELVVPDGTGLVWAADYGNDPVKERVAGFDLLHELLRKGNDAGWKVYLLGASPEVIPITAKRMQEQFPGIQLVGFRDGYFDSQEDGQIVEEIRQAAPDLLFVARATSNQEPWIYKFKQQLQVSVMMGVGGSFDIIAGKLKRAPKLFQLMRLEWLYRLLQEPTRYKRMLVLPRFVFKVKAEAKKSG